MYKYDEFSLHVREDGKIEAEFTPSLGTHERLEGQLTLSDKLRPFIENSIQRLRDAKLDEKELELLGESLYEALFPDSIGRDFTRYWRAVRKDREKRLRVSLSMEAGSEVVTWPLEFLRGPLGWLSTDSDLTLSRRIVFEEEHWDMVPDEPPLKVLVIVSQPNKMGGVMSAKVIEAIADWAQLEEKGAEPGDETISGRAAGPSTMTLRKPKVEVQLLGMMEGFEKIKIPGIEYLKRPASFTEFRSYSSNRDWRPQVIHFIGHGKFVRNEASLAMVDNGNDVDWIEASSFANAISEINPRLVVLQACQSARPGTSPTLLSLAALLVQNMIPAVVAMQFSIRNDYATLDSRVDILAQS